MAKKKNNEIITLKTFSKEFLFNNKYTRVTLIRDITQRKKNMEQLLESEKKYRQLIEKSPYLAYRVSTTRGGLFFSQKTTDILGYSVEELYADPMLWKNSIHPEDCEIVKKAIKNYITGNDYIIEYRLKNKTGDWVWLEDRNIGNISKVSDEEYIIEGIARNISAEKEFNRKILENTIKTEEKERQRFAAELHDGMGPLLSTVKLYLQWLQRPKTNTKPEELINRAEQTIEEALLSIREISNNLSPHLLEKFGIMPAVKSFTEKISKNGDIHISLSGNVNKKPDFSIESTLYRVVTECVNNTLKHSKANKIEISINREDENIILNYFDNGIGFDTKKISENSTGMGLFNIINRINTLDGKINIDTAPGQGFKLSIKMKSN